MSQHRGGQRAKVRGNRENPFKPKGPLDSTAQRNSRRGGGAKSGRSAPESTEVVSPSQPGGQVNAFGKSFDMSVPAEAKAYTALQQQELERQRTHSPFSDLRGGDGVGSDGRRLSPRGQQRVSPTGVVQTGTQTGPKEFTDHSLEGLFGGISKRYEGETADLVRDTRIFNHFSSNQLPTTGENPYGAAGANDPGVIEMIDGKKLDKPMSIAEYNAQNPNDNVSSGEQSVSSARQAQLNAFSDPNLDSMDGLRVREAAQGLVYASGQYWTPGQDGKLMQIDRDVAKQIKRGGDAQALLSRYVDNGGAKPDVELDSNGFTTPETNMLTLKDGTQKLMSDMTEEDWNM